MAWSSHNSKSFEAVTPPTPQKSGRGGRGLFSFFASRMIFEIEAVRSYPGRHGDGPYPEFVTFDDTNDNAGLVE